MKTSLSGSTIRAALGNLVEASTAFARRYPGETGRRQPVHTVYGGAHLFHAGLAKRLGEVALKTMAEYAPDAFTFARAIGITGAESLPKSGKQSIAIERRFAKFPEKLRHENRPAWLALTVYARVLEKLQREPVEDFRLDFEDGYGNRPDEEEDQHAASSAVEVAQGMRDGTLPPFIGIRIKPLNEDLRARSFRTLDIFITSLTTATSGKLPPNFVITVPKIQL